MIDKHPDGSVTVHKTTAVGPSEIMLIRKYHEWTGAELERVRTYVVDTPHPYSRYEIDALARELEVPREAVRGAVGRIARLVRSASARVRASASDQRRGRR